jgi:hypothetical protein
VLCGDAPHTLQGHCLRCQRPHSWQNDPARAQTALADLFAALPQDPALHAFHHALQGAGGKMIGVLLGSNAHGQLCALRAFSGDLSGQADWPGFVPSIIRREHTAALEQQTLQAIAKASTALQTTTGDARAALLRSRREASAKLMAAMIDHTHLRSAGGALLPLRAVMGSRGIPSGTADCVVPKLLHHAHKQHITPTAIAEAWWGPPRGTRRHGALQAPCAPRCQPLLGHLLCPAPA